MTGWCRPASPAPPLPLLHFITDADNKDLPKAWRNHHLEVLPRHADRLSLRFVAVFCAVVYAGWFLNHKVRAPYHRSVVFESSVDAFPVVIEQTAWRGV